MKVKRVRTQAALQRAMAQLHREGVPGPCSCGGNRDGKGYQAKYQWDDKRRAFSGALCPACGKQLPMIPFPEVTR